MQKVVKTQHSGSLLAAPAEHPPLPLVLDSQRTGKMLHLLCKLCLVALVDNTCRGLNSVLKVRMSLPGNLALRHS